MNKKTIILLGAFFMTNTLATPIQAAKKLNLPEIKPVNFQPPDGERLVLKNGIKVYFIEDKTLPVVHIKALIRSGSIYDEDDKTGLGEITINLLRDGGTKKYKAEEIEHKLDSLGASIESNIAAEEASLEMTSLAKDFTEVLDIFSQMLINPSFEEDKVNIQKAEQLAIIDRRFDNIGQALSREAVPVLWAKLSIWKTQRKEYYKSHKHSRYAGMA